MESKDNWKTDTSPSPGSGEQAGQDLRRQAEEELSRKKGALSLEHPEAQSPEETRLMLHELRVYQIELEMQNEELQKSHAEMDAIRERYFDLYDFAPVGYCTVSEKGLILEANLTAATLLGVTRGELVKKLFTRFIILRPRSLARGPVWDYRSCTGSSRPTGA
jgi:PAS domain-containing protein